MAAQEILVSADASTRISGQNPAYRLARIKTTVFFEAVVFICLRCIINEKSIHRWERNDNDATEYRYTGVLE